MDLYAFNTYKSFLHAYLEANKQKGAVSQMAKACGCDRTYMSQVLNGKAELTPDHLMQFCDNNNFSESESHYLLLLLLHDRSASAKAKRSFAEQVKKFKQEALILTNKIQSKEKIAEISDELKTLYYSHWAYGAIHILTSIPEFQTVEAISKKLYFSPMATLRYLKDLTDMKVVKQEKDRYIHSSDYDIYLKRQDPRSSSLHLNWRNRAVERTFEKDDIHYTNTFSISEEDIEKLRKQIVKFIEEQRALIQSSGTETAYTFCCDFFPV